MKSSKISQSPKMNEMLRKGRKMAEEKKKKKEKTVAKEVLDETVEEDLAVLRKVEKERDDFEDKFLRAQAEMQNIQRRANEEHANFVKYRSQDLAKSILPALDNLERALALTDLTDDVKKGLSMVQESLIAALKEEGITEVATDGKFDPNFHMAVQTIEPTDEIPAEQIAQVLQKGYQLHERVLRPAMVVVAQ